MIMLNTNKISEIGNYISEQMRELKINDSILNINVDVESFKKIDEDLYYRSNPNDDNFSPSQSKIKITFPCLEIFIYK